MQTVEINFVPLMASEMAVDKNLDVQYFLEGNVGYESVILHIDPETRNIEFIDNPTVPNKRATVALKE
uniref:Xylan 1,4-beta-xylosidase n=1 Tax=Caenorhabditis tropicalis TaxID=1561998 RepID=A0A1I7TTR9_9PELO